jgi:uncharacterized protein involved in exopolysaccharide biosynthesis
MTTQNKQNENDQVVDFIRLCLKHWYYFVISGIICLVVGVLYIAVKPQAQVIATTVALRSDNSFGSTVGSVGKQANGMLSMLGIGRSADNIEDETLILKSEGNLKDVVKRLELNKSYELPKFLGLLKDELYDQSPIILSVPATMPDTLSTIIIFNLNVKSDKTEVIIQAEKKVIGKYEIMDYPATLQTSWGNFTLEKSSFYEDYKKTFKLKIVYSNYDEAAQTYQKYLEIKYKKKTSNLIDASMKSENVDMAKKILITTIDSYNKSWDKDKAYGSAQTLAFIEQRLNTAELELINIDHQIQRFKDKYNLTDIEGDVKYYYTLSGGIQASLLETETQLNLVDVIREFIQNESNRYSLIPFNINMNASSDGGVAAIIEKYNEAILQRNELYQTNTPSSLAQSLDAQLDAQRKNIIQSLSNTKKGLQTALATIHKKDNEVSKKLGNLPSVERDYLQLKRQQEVQQAIYIFLLEKKEETAVHYASLMPKIKMIDHPYIVKDSATPKKKTIAIAILIGTMMISLLLLYGIPYYKGFRKKLTQSKT